MRIIWGVGTATQARLEAAGIRTIADLLRWSRQDLRARFGQMGERLYSLARGQDTRRVMRDEKLKSISKETTFHEDTSDPDLLDGHIWRLSEQVADRAKAKQLSGRTVTLKLKRGDFQTITRRHSLTDPTQLTDRIYRAARDLFAQAPQGPFRLIGVGISDLAPEAEADLSRRPPGPRRSQTRQGRTRRRCDPRQVRHRGDHQGPRAALAIEGGTYSAANGQRLGGRSAAISATTRFMRTTKLAKFGPGSTRASSR